MLDSMRGSPCRPALARRLFLVGGAAALAPTGARASREAFADGASILVAGPQGGHLDQWAGVLSGPLQRGLPPGTTLRRQTTGGADGVTAANQFEARVAPDGQTVMLLPGDAAIAWLAGDPRARFDAAHWVPVLSGITGAVLVSRVPATAFRPGARLRIGASGPAGPDLAALLGVELLGMEAVPLFGLHTPAMAQAALVARSVDAILLRGENLAAQVGDLSSEGVLPVFSLGLPNGFGEFTRDGQLPETPTLVELIRDQADSQPAPALFAAWRATAAAAQLDFGLVLPQLAPASLVSLWRRAAAGAAAAPELQGASAANGVRAIAAPARGVPPLVADATTLLELRRWLASRYNWRPA